MSEIRGRKPMSQTQKMTLSALLVALSVVILYIASILPFGGIGVAAVAGLLPAVIVIHGGLSYGAFCFAATALLSFWILPVKEMVLVYIFLFGHYPILKSIIERLGRMVLEWLCKLALFNGLLTILYFFFRTLFLAALPAALQPVLVLYGVGNLVFVLYDIGFSKLITFYRIRIARHLR